MAEHALVDLYTTSTDDVTIVEAYMNASFGGEQFVVHRAKDARRNPEDDCDPIIGQLLAHGRALESLGRRLQREAWGRIKHKDDMKLQKGIDEVLEWADMQVRKNIMDNIKQAVLDVNHIGHVKFRAITTYISEHFHGELPTRPWEEVFNPASWRWLTEQDPAEVSRTIYRDGVTHGISKHRVSEIQKGVKRVLDEHEALVRKTKDDLRGEQA